MSPYVHSRDPVYDMLSARLPPATTDDMSLLLDDVLLERLIDTLDRSDVLLAKASFPFCTTHSSVADGRRFMQ